VTIAAAELEIDGVPEKMRKGLPAYPIPCLRIARLAVAADAQGTGVGAQLLRHVLLLAKRLVEEIGCAGVLVDAKAEAVAFYAKYGFVELVAVTGALDERPRPTPMFLPMGSIPD
jgi:GNAT superfamily N-acetyltransferase